ncbi:MAG: Recombination protein RecR [Verrucomicrobiae bacterium]|nr:Recombination protein RecR [Verrucomicrobiae bacterium]
MDYPAPVQNLIAQIAKLPGIGKRSAERVALHLLKSKPDLSRQLAQAILETKSKIRNCSRCGSYTEADPCEICQGARRDQTVICVVEGPNDILSLEKTGSFTGVYHALMGRISPLNGIGPENLRIAALVERVRQEKPTEVIIALGGEVESDATAHYIGEQLQPLGVTVTRIGLGLPAGSALEAADEVTLANALAGRRQL